MSEINLTDGVVTLRYINRDDIELLRNWRNQDSVRHSFIYNNVITKQQQVEWFERYTEDNSDHMFISIYENKPVGSSALYNLNTDKKDAEYGRLMLGELNLRGLGLGKRMTELTAQFGFEFLELESMYCEIFADNHYSIDVCNAIGYQTTDIIEKDGKKMLYLTLTKDRWKQFREVRDALQ